MSPKGGFRGKKRLAVHGLGFYAFVRRTAFLTECCACIKAKSVDRESFEAESSQGQGNGAAHLQCDSPVFLFTYRFYNQQQVSLSYFSVMLR